MKTFEITLDGRRVAVKEGETLLDAARGCGIDIPALCYDPRLPPYTACFLCIVEVEGRRGMAPACATKASEGMTVRTLTENIIKLRKLGLELLLSNHHGDCTAPCNMACPAGIDVRSYLAEAARGNYEEALRIIKERNPFPSVCGRICPHPCEDHCRRRLVDSAVAINQVKRFLSDRGRTSAGSRRPAPRPKNEKKIAVIGGGPGGMSAARELAALGYPVVVFEAMPRAGGMLRYGVPDYRLPPEVLDAEIESISALGVEFRFNSAWGKDFHLGDLRKQGFSAIILAVGAWSGMELGVEGEDRPGVWSGIAMLEKANKGETPDLGQRVVVVGGGNTAMDCARTALRLGAREVSIVYRRGLKEMPANPEEIEEAREEGVKFYFLTAPAGFPGKGKISSLRCVKMELGEPDASGRRRPVPVPGSELEIPADSVIAAIGQKVRWDGFDGDGLKLTKWGTPQADPVTLEASQADVYICGDCLTGPATAIEAIAGGRAAALSAHNKLSGAKEPLAPHPFNIRKGKLEDLDPRDYDNYPKKGRAKVPQLPPAARARIYDEVSRTLTEEAALAEAGRCLLCGCREVATCLLRRYAEQYGAKGEEFKGEKTPAENIPDHPYIARDRQKCIMCGRCVRVCAELQGSGAIGLIGRGFGAQIAPAWSESLQQADCRSCGQCIAACPTGALSAKLKDERIPAWRAEERKVLCPYCGAGCILTVTIADDTIQRVNNKMGAAGEDCIVCAKGFTGFDLTETGNRLLEPMIKEEDGWRKADWSSALKAAAAGLKKAAAVGGPKSAAVLGSPRLTNEALYLLQKIGRAALGTNHISGPGIGGASGLTARSLGLNVSTAAREDIAASDLILVAGSDLEADHAGIASLIRRAVAAGTRLQVHSPSPTGLDRHAEVLRAGYPGTYHIYTRWLTELLREGTGAETVDGLSALKASLSRGKPAGEPPGDLDPAELARLGKAFLSARRPLVILDPLRVHPGELAALLDILLLKGAVGKPGAGLLLLRAASNAQGALDQGLDGRLLPGQLPVEDASARARLESGWGLKLPDWPGMSAAGILDAASAGTMKALLSWGDNGLEGLTLPGMFVVSGEWTVPSPEHPAAVVFPAALFSEDSGSQTSFDRRVSQAGGWRRKSSPKPNWEALAELAVALGLEQAGDLAALRREISGVNRLYEKLGWDKWGGNTVTESWRSGPVPPFRNGFLIPSEEETRESLEFFNYLAGEDLLERFIRARLKEVLSGRAGAGCGKIN